MAMSRLPALLLLLLLFGLTRTPGLAQELGPLFQSSPPSASVPGEILVKFRSEVGQGNRRRVLAGESMRTLAVSPYSGVVRLQVPPGQEAAMIAHLQAQGEVEYAQRNHIFTGLETPNDPSFDQQWHLEKIEAPAAWDIETGGSEVIIAILDSGVDLSHEDLQDNLWVNDDEIADNGIDDDANGFIDDVNGWNFCNSSSLIADPCNQPPDNNPDDQSGHGTHVAGIAAAVGNNGLGIAGVSWQATIMPVKVLDTFRRGQEAGIADGIAYATANGADIINLSLGQGDIHYPCDAIQVMTEAIQTATAQGVLVVGAAGNENDTQVSCPAALDEVIAVGATDMDDARWVDSVSLGSNQGDHLNVVAPGKDIYSSTSVGNPPYELRSGTSMAAPQAAGLAALLWSNQPDLTAQDVRSIIQGSVEDLGLAGFDTEFGYGRINARRTFTTVTSLQTTPAQINLSLGDDTIVPVPTDIQLISDSHSVVTWTATISPTVPWLSFASASSGIVTNTTITPVSVTLAATRPVTYGQVSTTVIVEGMDSGMSLGTRTSQITVTYGPVEIHLLYLPVVIKN